MTYIPSFSLNNIYFYSKFICNFFQSLIYLSISIIKIWVISLFL